MPRVAQDALPTNGRHNTEPQKDSIDLSDQLGVGQEEFCEVVAQDAVAQEQRRNEGLLYCLLRREEPRRKALVVGVCRSTKEGSHELYHQLAMHVDAEPVTFLALAALNRSLHTEQLLSQIADGFSVRLLVLIEREVHAVVGDAALGHEIPKPQTEPLVDRDRAGDPLALRGSPGALPAYEGCYRVEFSDFIFNGGCADVLGQIKLTYRQGLVDSPDLDIVRRSEMLRFHPVRTRAVESHEAMFFRRRDLSIAKVPKPHRSKRLYGLAMHGVGDITEAVPVGQHLIAHADFFDGLEPRAGQHSSPRGEAVQIRDPLGVADRVHDAAAGDEAEALEQPVELPGVALARFRRRLDAGDAPCDPLPHLDRGPLQQPPIAVPKRVLVDEDAGAEFVSPEELQGFLGQRSGPCGGVLGCGGWLGCHGHLHPPGETDVCKRGRWTCRMRSIRDVSRRRLKAPGSA